MKKTLLKVLALICVAVMAMGLFSGCGEDDGLITYRMWTDSSTPFEEQQVAKFNETIGTQNGFKLELTNYGSDYAKTVELAIANGNAPDFFKAQGLLSAHEAKGSIFPINKLPNTEKLISEYEHMLAENAHKVGDNIYTLPGRRIVYGFLYNKDMFKKAGIVDENGEAKYPKTWDEVLEYANLMTNPSEGEYGFIFPLKWGAAFWNIEVFNPVLAMKGKNSFDYENDCYDFSVYKDIMEVVMKIKDSGSLFPGSDSMENDAARAQFATGRVAMKMGVSWDVYVLNDQFPAECEWGACPIPKLNADDPDYYQFSTTDQLISVSSSVKDKNLDHISTIFNWYYSDERIGEMYQNAELIPAKSSITEQYQATIDKQGWADFGEIAKLAEAPATPNWVAIKYEGETAPALAEKVWVGMMSIDEMIAQLNRDYNAAYEVAKQENDMSVYYSIDKSVFDRTLPEAAKTNSKFFKGE